MSNTTGTSTDGYQYIRHAKLLIGTDKGDALDVSLLRLKFNLVAGDRQTPKTLEARVYNMADATTQRIQKEGAPIRLSVGYGSGALASIFNGNVTFIRRGRETQVDTYLDLVAADGDSAYNYAVVNKTLAAGHTAADIVAAVCDAANPFGIVQGDVSALPTTPALRGRSIYGMAKTVMRDVTASTGTTWKIEDGRLSVSPASGPAAGAGPAIVLSSATGMLGIPQQTPEGICVRCLLNPRIRSGMTVQINNKDIAKARVGTGVSETTAAAFLPRVAEDGFYKVLLVQHRGDTRGEDWFSDLICVAQGDIETRSFATRGYLEGT